jgi:hypothetical protein
MRLLKRSMNMRPGFLFNFGPKAGSDVEVGLLVAWPRHYFEEQANHL